MVVKNVEIFLKKKKTKSINVAVNHIKILQKMRNYFSIEKNILECKR